MKPTTADAYELFHLGSQCFADIENAGIKIDLDYLSKTEKEITQKINSLEQKLMEDEVCLLWRKKFGSKFKLGSDKQLGEILFEDMGFDPVGFTATGKYKTDKLTFDHLNHPFAKKYVSWKELKKARDTNIKGIRNETVDGFLHCSFNLHTVRSFRSSSTKINLHNQNVRNKETSKIIRTSFIPRKDHVFIEGDFKMLEVCTICCHNLDPVLINYVTNPKSDMHKDAATDIFILPPEEVSDDIRFYAKNQFVFAVFYGSYYKQCAPLLWQSIDRFKLRTTSGVLLKDHLKSKKIKRLGECNHDLEPLKGSFEYHLREVERRLWDKFCVYAQWKKDYLAAYQARGYIDYPTGFRVAGVFKRNEIYSLSNQGSAFHCLLWVLIEMNKWLKKNKMRSVIVNEIHDSIIIDAHKDEVKKVVAKLLELATIDLLKAWSWIIVPLRMDISIGEKNWHEKKKYNEKEFNEFLKRSA